MSKSIQQVRYDSVWIQLIKEAKNIGLTPTEVRVYLNKMKKRSQYTS